MTTIERKRKVVKITPTDCGMVHIEILHHIFGNEMSYNEMKRFDKEYYHLKVWVNDKIGEGQGSSVRVWFDNFVVMDKKYSNEAKSMFYYLRQLQNGNKLDEEKNEDGEGDYDYYNEDMFEDMF